MNNRAKKTAAIAIALMTITACSSAPAAEVEPLTNPVLGEVPEGALSGATFTFAGDGGTTQEAMASAYLEPFAKESGVTLAQDSPQTLAKLEAQINSGNIQWDVVTSYADSIERECGTYFETLDKSKLDTSKIPDSVPVLDCAVPSIIYGVNIVYNTDVYGDNGPETWEDFFDTEKYPGKRTFYNGDGKVDAALVQAGAIAAGWDPSTPFTVEWANKGLDKIESIADSVIFYSTGASAQQLLESGDASIGAVWTGRSLQAAKNGAPIKATWNQWIGITDYFAIVKGSPNMEVSYYFLNYALGAEQQAAFTEASGYAPANVDAVPEVDELTKEYMVTTPDKSESSVPVDAEFWSDRDVVSPLQDRWSAIVAGAE